MHTFADRDLAARLEALAARGFGDFATVTEALFPEVGATSMQIGSGIACFCGAGSPVNSATGLGFAGEIADDEVEQVERFFRDLGERPVINLCPLAHPSLALRLLERGWSIQGFENVLVRDLDASEAISEPDSHVEIRACETAEERELWAAMVANGFSAPEDPTLAELRLGATAASRDAAILLMGYVDGTPAGTGELEIFDGVAWLSADTTLPQFRGRGVQRSLQRERLRLGQRAGATLAVSESIPGSGSQRNMERAGFRVAYTRADVAAPPAPTTD